MATTDQKTALPASVTVLFPRTDDGAPADTPTAYEIHIDTAAPPGLADDPAGFDGTRVLRSGVVATWSGGSSATNDAELQALAERIAHDWYAWQMAPLDAVYHGPAIWEPDGGHDLIFDHGAGTFQTRVCRGPWLDHLDQAGFLAAVETPANSTVNVKGGTPAIASFTATTIDFDATYTTITNSPTGEANVELVVASATSGGVLTDGEQEIAGIKSLIDIVRFPSLGANTYFVYGDVWPDGSGFGTYSFHIARQTTDVEFLPGYTVSRISLGRTPYETIDQTGAILLDVANFDNSENTSIELKYNEILFKGSYSYPLIRFNVGSEYKTGQTGTDVFGTVHQSGILVEYGTGGSQGDIIYRSDFSSGWQRLSPGTSGQFLQTQGPGANPLWADAPDSGSGDTSGPSSSVDGEIALFDGTTGKLLKRATGSGGVEAASGVYSTYTLTAAGKALLDDASASDQRTTLGLGTLATKSSVTTAEIAAATLVTESEGIGSNANDTTLPTSAAVKDYVDDAVAAGSGAPAGAIVMYGGAGTPTGWLRCDGSAVSRTTYAALFAVIGTTWGAGDGSTSFNLPNFAGRSPIGQGTGSGLTNRVQGTTGGTETHTLTTAQMPAHTHGPASDADGFWDYFASGATLQAGSTYGAASRSATGSTGGDGSHPNMHPWLAISFLIKT